MAADGAIRFEISLDLGRIKTEIADASRKINDKFTGAFSAMGRQCQESCDQAGKSFQQMGAGVDATREKINAILGDTSKNMSSKASSISWIYRKQGMDAAQAMKTAWAEIDRTSAQGADTSKKTWDKLKKDSQGGSQEVKRNIKGIGDQADQTAAQVQGKLPAALKRIAAVMGGAFAVKKLFDFGKSCIELGSDLSEVQNVVDVVFPGMNKQIDQFAKNAAMQFGLSETMAKRYSGTFGAMAKAFGFGEKAAYDMSTTLTGLAGDVASFYNINQDEAYTKLKSVFTGETESLKDLGIVMTQTALDSYALQNGFGKTTAKMSEMEKVALRYKFVQDQLTSAAGDFSRTSDSWANQVRILQLQFEGLKATIGQGLINVLSPVIKVINTIIGKLMSLANAFKAFTELVTGKKGSGGASAAAAGMEAVAKSADKAGTAAGGAGSAAKKAAKDMKSVSSSLDELHIIDPSSGSDSGSGGSGGGAGGYESDDFDMGTLPQDEDVVSEKLKGILALVNQLKESFAAGFWDGFGDTAVFDSIQGSIQGIKNSLREIFSDSDVQAAALEFANTLAYSFGQITGAIGSVGATIADNVLGGIDLYLQQNSGRIKEYLIAMFDIGGDIASLAGNFSTAFADIFSVFRSDSAKQITADIIGIFSSSFQGVTELGGKFARDILQVITKPITDNADQIKQRVQGLLDELQPKFDALKKLVDGIWDGLNAAYDAYAKPVFDAVTGALSAVVEWITATQERFDFAVGTVAAFFAAWEVVKLGEFIINAGGIVSILSGLAAGFVANTGAIIAHAAALVIDKIETAAIVAMYAKDFVVNLAAGTAELVKQAAQFAMNTAAKIADTAAQIAMTAATVAWNAVCAIATTVTTALSAAIAFLTSPIGLVIIAITALIAAGVLLYKNWDTISAFAKSIWTAIKETINNAIQAVKDWISEKMEEIGSFWEEKWNAVKEFAQTAWNGIKQVVQTVFTAIKQAIISILVSIFGTWQQKWNLIKSFASTLWNGIKDLSSELFSALRDKLSEIWDSVKETIEEKWTSIKEWFDGIWKNIKDVFSLDEMLEIGKGIMNKLWDGMDEIWKEIKKWLSGAADFVGKTFNGIVDGAKNIFKSAKEEAEADDEDDEDDGGGPSGGGYVDSGPGVRGHASGGFPKAGEMFVARENGIPEMVGSWGGRAAVANNQQITQGITQAVQRGMSACMTPLIAQMSVMTQHAAPPLATVGTSAPVATYRTEDDRLQGMVDRAVMASSTASAEQLTIMIELLRRIIELIENLDLVVNIDIRELRKKLKDLEKRSGVKFD